MNSQLKLLAQSLYVISWDARCQCSTHNYHVCTLIRPPRRVQRTCLRNCNTGTSDGMHPDSVPLCLTCESSPVGVLHSAASCYRLICSISSTARRPTASRFIQVRRGLYGTERFLWINLRQEISVLSLTSATTSWMTEVEFQLSYYVSVARTQFVFVRSYDMSTDFHNFLPTYNAVNFQQRDA